MACLPACLLVFAGSVFAREPRPSERDGWQMPDQVVSALGLRNGEVVADIGAGAGYFTMRLARAVGAGGKVYAVDIAAKPLDFIERQARKEGLSNVEVILSRKDDPLLPARGVDVAFFCLTIREMDERVPFYRKVGVAMKRGGRMVLIDFSPGAEGAQGKQVPRATAVHEAEAAGFRLVREETFLPQQYFLIFRKLSK